MNYQVLYRIISKQIERLHRQHKFDLLLYQSSHTVLSNRIIHYVLIPVETFSFILFWYSVINLIQQLYIDSALWTRFAKIRYGYFRHQKTSSKGTTTPTNTHPRPSPPSSKLSRIILLIIGVSLGILSLILAPDWIGLLSFLYHTFSVQVVFAFEMVAVSTAFTMPIVRNPHDNKQSVKMLPRNRNPLTIFMDLSRVSTLLWIVSFFIQIVVGHWILEKNNPTMIASTSSTSLLSILQSVLIAWRS